jgi:regulator of sirC expression with transglutaminase-like and TPR domain
VVSARECFQLAGVDVPDIQMLARASKKQIVMRMLQNLQRAYMQAREYPQAVAVLNYLLEGAPDVAAWRKLRGALLLELKRFSLAVADLDAYLEMQPDAADGDFIRQQIRSIRQWSARNN